MMTTVVLVFMTFSSAGAPSAMLVQELTDMRLCESAGSQLAAMALPSKTKWTCIEGPR